jgi:hypothetical protein
MYRQAKLIEAHSGRVQVPLPASAYVDTVAVYARLSSHSCELNEAAGESSSATWVELVDCASASVQYSD